MHIWKFSLCAKPELRKCFKVLTLFFCHCSCLFSLQVYGASGNSTLSPFFCVVNFYGILCEKLTLKLLQNGYIENLKFMSSKYACVILSRGLWLLFFGFVLPNLSQINYCYLAAFKWLLSSSWFSVCFRSVFPLQFCFSPPLQHCLLNFKNYTSKDFSSTGQVRLFLSEDSPLQSGQRMQDLLQAKAAWLLPAAGLKSEDSLLPGFEERRRDQHPQIEILQIPLIRWQCPPRVGVSPNLLSCKL